MENRDGPGIKPAPSRPPALPAQASCPLESLPAMKTAGVPKTHAPCQPLQPLHFAPALLPSSLPPALLCPHLIPSSIPPLPTPQLLCLLLLQAHTMDIPSSGVLFCKTNSFPVLMCIFQPELVLSVLCPHWDNNRALISMQGNLVTQYASPPRLTSLITQFTGTLAFRGFPDSSVGKESACNARNTGSIPGSGRSTGEGIGYPLRYSWASLVAQLVKNPPAMWETWVRSLGWENPWKRKGYPLRYSGLENSVQSMGSQRVRHD